MSSSPKPVKPRLGRGLASLISNSAMADVSAAQENLQAAPAGAYAADVASPHGAEIGTAPVSASTDAGRGTEMAAAREAHGQADGGTVSIAVDLISPNPYQPRREFNETDLAELAGSIAEQGILQPLIVAVHEGPGGGAGGYVLIAGERRLRAARKIGMSAVPCIVRAATPQQMLEWALIENIQRADLNPVEKATAYRDYLDRFNLTQAQASQRLGQPRATLANYLRILDLPDAIQTLLLGGDLSFGHAKALAGLAGKEVQQLKLAKLCLHKSLSVRQLESMVSQIIAGMVPAGKTPSTRKSTSKPPYIADLEGQLTAAVGTRVEIKPARAANTGRIVVDYYSLDDFDRITGALGAKISG
ncbi:MAG: ParB/RepB/Spo0J family partition protein [Planctomycetaceae bacterium]